MSDATVFMGACVGAMIYAGIGLGMHTALEVGNAQRCGREPDVRKDAVLATVLWPIILAATATATAVGVLIDVKPMPCGGKAP